MKQIGVITPVPEIIDTIIQNSILRQAVNKGVVQFHVLSLRDFAKGRYRQVDDTPFGGGSGMVLMPKPLFKAIDHIFEVMDDKAEIRVIYPSPQGKLWSQETASDCSQVDKLVFICGHYKGIDERVVVKYVTHEYSLGDYVTTSGELPTMIMIDSIVRLIPGVLNTYESALSDSFTADLLDTPHYTRPQEIEAMKVPEILLSGHHKNIEKWGHEQREKRTKERRPDLWKEYVKKQKCSE